MRRVLIRYLKFMGTSVVGTIVDTLVLWILSDFIFTKGYWGEYVISPVISFQCALTANFLISYFYVWKDRTVVSGASTKRFFKLYFTYNLSGSAVFLLRLGALLIIEKFTGWDVVICNLLAMCVSGVLNFAINNLLIFKKKRKGGAVS